MTLPDYWFLAIGFLFTGYFVLEGFDFGVGMLMPILGRKRSHADAEKRRRVLLNTIGPVWDGNEVWVITGGALLFAAFRDAATAEERRRLAREPAHPPLGPRCRGRAAGRGVR